MPSDSQRSFLEKASSEYQSQLTEDAIAYLKGPKRGLDDEDIEKWRLGVVADPLPGHEKFTGYLTIPYLTNYGVVSIRYRRLGDPEGEGKKPSKYLTAPGDMPRLYNPAALQRGTRGICVSEGEFDCIIAEKCDLPCIGIPGATTWVPIWKRLLEQYDQVMLLQDDGEAGQKMAETLGKELKNLRPVIMTGDDTTSFFLEHGREALRRKVIGK